MNHRLVMRILPRRTQSSSDIRSSCIYLILFEIMILDVIHTTAANTITNDINNNAIKASFDSLCYGPSPLILLFFFSEAQ